MRSASRILKMIGYMKDYDIWDDINFEHSIKFHEEYVVYPNLLLANMRTFGKIDGYANRIHPERFARDMDTELYVDADMDEDTDDDENRSISSFETGVFRLEFSGEGCARRFLNACF